MNVTYVVFRYQPDLNKDNWCPLGVVAECVSADGNAEVGVVCLTDPTSIEIHGNSDLAEAMLSGAAEILNKEVQNTMERLRPNEDFLEVLRAQNPWNFHFTVPEKETVEAADVQQATWTLFYRSVLQKPARHGAKTKRAPKHAIRPRRMEAYELAV